MITSAILQLIAMLTMAIDHLGLYLFDNNSLMRIIGRAAFPLYAFMIAEGFRHTRSRKKYFGRLLALALLSEPLLFALATVTHVGYSEASLEILHETGDWLRWFISAYYHSVIFTLIFGFLSLVLVERAEKVGQIFTFSSQKNQRKATDTRTVSFNFSLSNCLKKLIYYALILLLVVSAHFLHLDYGAGGVLMVLGFFLARRYFSLGTPKYFLALACTLLSSTIVVFFTTGWQLQLLAILAFLPLLFYNGQKGHRLPKYLFYAYYPAHLIIIMFLRMIFYY